MRHVPCRGLAIVAIALVSSLAAAPVLHAVERLGARTEDAAFVGDSPHDIVAGNAAGVATVATLWGPFGRAELALARPRAWAASPEDVLPVLEGLGTPGA